MIENKVPSSINLNAVHTEFKERGSTNIVEASPYSIFQNIFEGSSLQHAYFSNFTQKFPGPAVGVLSLDSNVEKIALSGFSYIPFNNGDTNKYRINRFLPWILAYDTAANEYINGTVSVQLIETIQSESTAFINPVDAYGFKSITNTNFTVNGSDGIYDLKLKTASDNISIKAFGFIFDIEEAI